jgi:hypothetical protein
VAGIRPHVSQEVHVSLVFTWLFNDLQGWFKTIEKGKCASIFSGRGSGFLSTAQTQPTTDIRGKLTKALKSTDFCSSCSRWFYGFSHVANLVSNDAITVGRYRSCGESVHGPKDSWKP